MAWEAKIPLIIPGSDPDILGFPIPSFLSGLFFGISDRNDILA